ncbi:hypothetical protein PO124_27375 [Bacillus licheniformis]|nr:hypothetical protein [Bacillus licheniformis]
MSVHNPLTEQVKKIISPIYGHRGRRRNIFPEIRFPDEEIAFIVLHFGSALEMSKQK